MLFNDQTAFNLVILFSPSKIILQAFFQCFYHLFTAISIHFLKKPWNVCLSELDLAQHMHAASLVISCHFLICLSFSDSIFLFPVPLIADTLTLEKALVLLALAVFTRYAHSYLSERI
jgi:hypothetical protein